jgi:DNA polymerase sigma
MGRSSCANRSIVDICITTDWKEMEGVCTTNTILDGMERVICVSTAKVPIVKIWDPELQLACDMNVNNTLALENTRMVKTYVQIDPRVRPLAMIIKHWTKRRIVNDAGE